MTGLNNYTNQDLVLQRLIKEWETHGKVIVAFDFDNTVYDYHNIGLSLATTRLAICATRALGNEVYCFTANVDHDLVEAYCKNMMGFVPAINKSSIDHLFASRKPFYSLLLDDRAGLSCALRTLNQLNNYIRENK